MYHAKKYVMCLTCFLVKKKSFYNGYRETVVNVHVKPHFTVGNIVPHTLGSANPYCSSTGEEETFIRAITSPDHSLLP